MRVMTISAAAVALALGGLSAEPAQARGANTAKYAVCHFAGNMRDDTEARSGRVLNLPLRAAVAHSTSHGDAPLFVVLPQRTFRTGEDCGVGKPPPNFLTGPVTVGDDVVLPALTEDDLRNLLIQAVEQSDLSLAEKTFLLGLIARAFPS